MNPPPLNTGSESLLGRVLRGLGTLFFGRRREARLEREMRSLRRELAQMRDVFGEEIRSMRWRLYHDRLTGLPNESALHRSLEDGYHPWFVSIDLDGFKAAQDAEGSHAWGNEILKAFADFLKAHTRQGDPGRSHDLVAYRPHGDEFVIACSSEMGARRIARLVEDWHHEGVTATAGLGRTLDAADGAMYRRKHAKDRPPLYSMA